MKTFLASLVGMIIAVFSAFASDGYKVGDAARDFSLKNVDGSMVSLASHKEAREGVILVFTCNHCPYAKAYESRIIDLHKKFAPKGYPVVAVNPNDPKASPEDSFEKMIQRAKEKSFPFVYLFDETQEIAKTYGATRTPHVYLLKKNGDAFNVAYIGAIDDNSESAEAVKEKYLDEAVSALLSGKSPATTSTKAVGCTIKWKKK